MRTVTTRGDDSSPLGLGQEFPMRRDNLKFSDQVHLKDQFYAEVADEIIAEFNDTSYEDPKAAWKMEAGQVVALTAPPGMAESWDQFLQGERCADEVQLWNEAELFQEPQQLTRQVQRQQQHQQQQQQWGGYGRARGGRGGYRGRGCRGRRGYTPGVRRQSWHETSSDRRQITKSYFFN